MDDLRTAYHRGWGRPDRRPIDEWAYDNVYLPEGTYAKGGWFDVGLSPYLRYPFALLQDDTVRQINIRKAVQTFGTGVAEIWLQWLFANDPGPTMMTFQTDDEADEHYRTRLEPVFQSSPANRDLYRECKARRGLKKFPHMDLYINGANLSSLQRKSIKYSFNDEVWIWDPGIYGEAIGRTEAFPFNCKILNASQAGIEGDEWDDVWDAGKRHLLAVRCLECGHLQPYEFFASMQDDPEERAGIVWSPDAKREDGTWDKERAAQSTRFRCRHCGHEHPDDPRQWDRLRKTMEYVDLDPDRPSRNISLRWQMLVRGVWGKYVEEYLTALEARDRGSITPLRQFYQKKLVIPWKEDMSIQKVELRTAGYSRGEVPDTGVTFLAADYQEGKRGQGEHYWYVVRTWQEDGRSRLVDEGRADTPDDLYTLQERYQIDPPRVVLDGGDRLMYLAGIAAKYGWTLMEGSHREAFPHKVRGRNRPVSKPYAPRRSVDPGRGTRYAGRRRVYSFMWSNPTVKDITYRLRHGRGVDWDLPDDISRHYEDQIDSEEKVPIRNRKSGAVAYIWKKVKDDNHLWDCECMQTVCALILGVLTSDGMEEEEPLSAAEEEPSERARRPRRRRETTAPHERGQQLELIST